MADPTPDPTSDQTVPFRRRLIKGGILILFALLLALAAFLRDRPAHADSDLPVPRFVSIKSSPANVRRGPGRDHEILWVYRQAPLPVEIIAEHQDWRRIRDWDGDEGWIYQALLSSRRSVIVTGQTATLRAAPDPAAAAVALAEPGVVANLVRCDGDWCEVEADGRDGWVTRDAVWGVYPDEAVGND
ncbi:MAG: SH3 domain-containing protein [Alphaproteobacteria bacterium]